MSGLTIVKLTIIITIFILWMRILVSGVESQKVSSHVFGPSDSSYYTTFKVILPATISNEALQVIPDSTGNFSLTNRSSQIFFNDAFWLWEQLNDGGKKVTKTKLTSFDSSFIINIFCLSNSSTPGEVFAFLRAPGHCTLPSNSHG